jgi:hypothetical protein
MKTNFFWSFVLFTFMGFFLPAQKAQNLLEFEKVLLLLLLFLLLLLLLLFFVFYCFCLCFWRRRIKGGEIKKGVVAWVVNNGKPKKKKKKKKRGGGSSR